MIVNETKIRGVVELVPQKFGDDRGFFVETWNARRLVAAGIDIEFVQDNLSFTSKAGTLRGLHLQRPPIAQAKLVRCVRGSVLDVAVDIRQGSPTYLNHVSIELSAKAGNQLFVPTGFLHGFITLEDDVEFAYKCSAYYDASSDVSIKFDDPAFGIDWGKDVNPTLSPNDAEAMCFKDFENPFFDR